MWVVSVLPVVQDELLDLLGVEGQVIKSTPSSRMFRLFSAGLLVVFVGLEMCVYMCVCIYNMYIYTQSLPY